MEKYIPVVVIKELEEVDKILPALKTNNITILLNEQMVK